MSRTLAVVLRTGLTPEREDAVLRAIADWDGVRTAGRVNPRAKHPRLRRLACVEVVTEHDVNQVLYRLEGVAEIETAARAAERGPPTDHGPHDSTAESHS
jgi:hypothetical protein